MPEITDKDLASIYSNLSSCSPLVRGLAERLKRAEHERKLLAQGIGDALVATGLCNPMPMTGPQLLLFLRDLSESHTSLRERMKRMEEALQVYADEREWSYGNDPHWRLLFNSTDMDGDGYVLAQAALKEGGE